MQFDEIKDFKGLYIQPNSFDLPKGSLETANNVIIEDKNTISRIRGFYTYFTRTGSDVIRAITSFKESIVALYADQMVYYTDTGSSPNITGTENVIPNDGAVDIGSGTAVTPVFEEANDNLYVTTDDGIIKLSDVTGNLYQAGAPPALDLFGEFDIGTSASWWNFGNTTSSFTPTSLTVGYRIVFGYTDSNDNLILGAPSGIFVINNPMVVATATSAGSLVTVTSPTASHGLTTGMQMQFFNAGAGWTTPANAEGSYTITSTGANTFTYTASSAPGGGGPISYAYAMETRLEFTVPSQISTDINTGWFYRVYRSDQQNILVGVQSDFKLIDEKFLTQEELDNKVVFYNDDRLELFKGDLLYTNQNSGEGELQANTRPPKAEAMALYNKYMFYGNCENRHTLEFSVVDPLQFAFLGTSYLEITVGSINRRYTNRSNDGNKETAATGALSGVDLLVTKTAHGIPTLGPSTIYISENNGTLDEGIYYVLYSTANTFKLAENLADWQSSTAISYAAAGSPTTLTYENVKQPYAAVPGATWTRSGNVVTVTSISHALTPGLEIYVDNSSGGSPNVTANVYFVSAVINPNTFQFVEAAADSTGGGQTLRYNDLNYVFYFDKTVGTASEQRRDFANYLVRAINRDEFGLVYADYTSSPIDTPGNMRLTAKDFTDPIYLYVSDSSAQEAFYPTIPVFTTTPDQVFSANPSQINAVYYSKLQEPEAVPIVNFIPIGSENYRIMSIHSITNSLIIIKEDGVFRLSGDSPANFSVNLLDATVISQAVKGATIFANQVCFLSNQGICLVSDTAVQIISRPIENNIQYALGQATLDDSTCAVAYEVDRTYKLTTLDPDGNTILYNYNILTDTWTTSEGYFSSAVIGSGEVLYHVSMDQTKIYKERKDKKKTDYTNQNYSVTVVDASANPAIVIQSSSYIPKYGDMIVKNDEVSIIRSVVMQFPGTFLATFFSTTNLEDSDSVQLYESYDADIKLAPITGGHIGLNKQFSQIQIHFRDRAVTALDLSFASDSYSNSGAIEWVSPRSEPAWGQYAWATITWGSTSYNDFDYYTTPAPIMRAYVSRLGQRSTFIQPILINKIGGDRLDIQSINIAMRKYGERVSR